MDRRVKERLVGATILVVFIVLIVPELLSGPKARVMPLPSASATGPVEPLRNVTVDLATSKATAAENTAASAAAASAENIAAGAANPGGAASGDAAPGDAASEDGAAGDITAPGAAHTAGSTAAEAPAGVGVPAAGNRVSRSSAPPTIATLKAQQPSHSAQPMVESEPSAPRSAVKASKFGNVADSAAAAAAGHHWAVQLGSFASRANADMLVRRLKPRDASLYVSSSGRRGSLRYRVRIGPLADRDAAERMMAKLKKEGQAASLVPP